jgi:hypothetical protein
MENQKKVFCDGRRVIKRALAQEQLSAAPNLLVARAAAGSGRVE